MYLSINSAHEIKAVGVSSDSSLTSVYVNEKAEDFPFNGWSDVKICCYKINVNSEGIITMMTPYVDSRLIEHLDQCAVYKTSKTAYIGDTECDFTINRSGNISVFCTTESGSSVPTTTERIGNTLRVSFDALTEVATVTISII